MSSTDNESIETLLERVASALRERGTMVATAESCTGGLVAKLLTDLSGSSEWFERGFVTYSNAAKHQLLGVDARILASEGAVSEATVLAMANGAVARSEAQLAVAISGVAGPSGGTAVNPVGSVWFAWAGAAQPTRACHAQLAGDRDQIRQRSAVIALQGLLAQLAGDPLPQIE